MYIDESTPIAALSVSEFRELFREMSKVPHAEKQHESAAKRYVYGLKGIQDLFKCSHLTAQRYKDGLIKDACMQSGRKIIVDVDHALELFNASKS